MIYLNVNIPKATNTVVPLTNRDHNQMYSVVSIYLRAKLLILPGFCLSRDTGLSKSVLDLWSRLVLYST